MKIGIVGLAGAGKDTVAQAIQQAYDVELDKYAAPLKDAARHVFGDSFDDRDVKEVPVVFDDRMWWDAADAVVGLCDELDLSCDAYLSVARASEAALSEYSTSGFISPRQFQQAVGTDGVRAVDPDAFVRRIKCTPTYHYLPLLVTDVRFVNELCDYNILVVRNSVYEKAKVQHTHESEALAMELNLDFLRLNAGVRMFERYGKTFNVVNNCGDLRLLQHLSCRAFSEISEATKPIPGV